MIHQVSNYVFVNYDFGVPPFCLHAMPILPDFQLPKQNKADIVTTKSESTKCSRRPDGSLCNLHSRTDFIADVGGYLGLFLGASILSFYDIMVTFVGKLTKNSGLTAKASHGRNGKSGNTCREAHP